MKVPIRHGDKDQVVIKGYLICVDTEEFKFNFNPLPSPLTPRSELPLPSSIIVKALSGTPVDELKYGWDICPRLQVFSVAIRSQDRKRVYPKFQTSDPCSL